MSGDSSGISGGDTPSSVAKIHFRFWASAQARGVSSPAYRFLCLPNAMQFSRPVFSLGGMCTCGCKGRNDVLFACAVYYFSNLVSKTFERFFLFPTYFRKVPAIFLASSLEVRQICAALFCKMVRTFFKNERKTKWSWDYLVDLVTCFEMMFQTAEFRVDTAKNEPRKASWFGAAKGLQ